MTTVFMVTQWCSFFSLYLSQLQSSPKQGRMSPWQYPPELTLIKVLDKHTKTGRLWMGRKPTVHSGLGPNNLLT